MSPSPCRWTPARRIFMNLSVRRQTPSALLCALKDPLLQLLLLFFHKFCGHLLGDTQTQADVTAPPQRVPSPRLLSSSQERLCNLHGAKKGFLIGAPELKGRSPVSTDRKQWRFIERGQCFYPDLHMIIRLK